MKITVINYVVDEQTNCYRNIMSYAWEAIEVVTYE